MPFSTSEMAYLCGVLRDIALGLIDLALPDAKPTIGDNYKEAFLNYNSNPSHEAERHRWNQLFEVCFAVV